MERRKLVVGQEPLAPGDLLGTTDFEPLPVLDGTDEVRGIIEGVEGAGIEPGGAPVKWLHREITGSRTYQLSWRANATNRDDERNFSRAAVRRLPAEVAVDAVAQATAGAKQLAAAASEVKGRRTAVGIIPTEDELDLTGMDVPTEDLERILSIDTDRWRQEMGFREEHLKQFDRLPEEIWAAHRRVASDLG